MFLPDGDFSCVSDLLICPAASSCVCALKCPCWKTRWCASLSLGFRGICHWDQRTPWSWPITWSRGPLEFSPMVRLPELCCKGVKHPWSLGLFYSFVLFFLFLNRPGSPESGENPAHRRRAQSVYIPSPGEHSAACRVLNSLLSENHSHVHNIMLKILIYFCKKFQGTSRRTWPYPRSTGRPGCSCLLWRLLILRK